MRSPPTHHQSGRSRSAVRYGRSDGSPWSTSNVPKRCRGRKIEMDSMRDGVSKSVVPYKSQILDHLPTFRMACDTHRKFLNDFHCQKGKARVRWGCSKVPECATPFR